MAIVCGSDRLLSLAGAADPVVQLGSYEAQVTASVLGAAGIGHRAVSEGERGLARASDTLRLKHSSFRSDRTWASIGGSGWFRKA
jgi:hypothetical protein